MLSVLSVETEDETLISWQAECDSHRYATLVATDGTEALDVLQSKVVDVVVAARNGRGLSGCELWYHMG